MPRCYLNPGAAAREASHGDPLSALEEAHQSHADAAGAGQQVHSVGAMARLWTRALSGSRAARGATRDPDEAMPAALANRIREAQQH